MSIFAKVSEMLSIYIVLAMLGIGVYMVWIQSHGLDTVSHLEREAKFTKIVGYIYIGVSILSGLILVFF